MGMIYLAQPRGNRIRSIDKLKPKDRKKPANCNDSNVKFGKHLSNFSDLKDRYERLVGDVDVKVIVNIPDNQIQEFESVLKRVFVKYIKKFQEESQTATREWMSGISIDEAKQTILSEFEKHKNFYQDERWLRFRGGLGLDMNKFKFDFNYIKKYLNKKNFLKDIYVLEKDSNKVSGDKYGGGDMFFKVIRNSFDGDDDDDNWFINIF